MNTSTLISLLVGLGIPALTAIVTKAGVPTQVKAYTLLFLSTATGVLTGLTTNPPGTLSQWEHVLLNIVAAFIAAVSANGGFWTPTPAGKAIERRTAKFGIGTPDPHGKHEMPGAA